MARGISGWNSKEGRTCREKKSTIEDVASRRSGERFRSRFRLCVGSHGTGLFLRKTSRTIDCRVTRTDGFKASKKSFIIIILMIVPAVTDVVDSYLFILA